MGNQPIISCQISFYPLNTKKVNEEVKKVLKIIEASHLIHESNPLSTIVYGEADKVYALLQSITEKMNHAGSEFSMAVHISNRCGCDL